ncbi:MAG: ATP synthase F0 subunit C [Bacteriovoracaceae bacterium]|nr:ATP synthase F0 subunit C [Bacteriovoracaceae bacterium]
MNKFLVAFLAVVVSGAVFAQEGGMTTLIPMNEFTKIPMYFLAVAFAAYAGTRAQSAAASVALEGMARNPAAADKLFVPMILGLALMESLVIFTLITIFLV